MPNYLGQVRFLNYSEIGGDQIDERFDTIDGLLTSLGIGGTIVNDLTNILITGGPNPGDDVIIQKAYDYGWDSLIMGAKATLKFRASVMRPASATSNIMVGTPFADDFTDHIGFEWQQNAIHGTWGNGSLRSTVQLIGGLLDDYFDDHIFEARYFAGSHIDYLVDDVVIASPVLNLPRQTAVLNPLFQFNIPGATGAGAWLRTSRIRVQANL